MNKFSPWVEKYRPSSLSDVVLDDTNKEVLNNIIEKNYFPNLLFYGPPGTGKTTTIINLIDAYQDKYNQKNKAKQQVNTCKCKTRIQRQKQLKMKQQT